MCEFASHSRGLFLFVSSLGLRDELSVSSNYTPRTTTHSLALKTCFESTTAPVDVVDGLYKAP